MLEFTDTQTPKGQTTFTYEGLQNQVDDAFGKGYFARSTNVYSKSRELYGKNIMFEGKMQPVGRVIAKQKIINDFKKNTNGKMPTEEYINKRITTSTPTQVHHTKGIGNDPYSVQLVSRDANQKLNAAELTYTSELKKAKGDPLKIKTLNDNFKTSINQISDTYGGIQYDVDGSVIGKKATEQTAYTSAVQESGMTKNKQMQILQNIQSSSKLPQCKVGSADGGRIGFAYSDECIRDGLKEKKIEAQKGNKKAAQELVQVGKVATRAGLLRNLLGPGAILGEAVYEGVVMGNKILEGTPKDIAWAESYLSYLDPRKYTPEGLDPLKMRREDMITREDFSDPDYAEDPYTLEMVKQGESKTIDGPNANILRSGFAAQDQVSAFNEAVNEKLRGENAGRLDIANRAAADVREQGRFVNQSKDIISSDAFQDATKQAQEYIANKEAQNRFNLGVFGTPQGQLSDDRRRFEANKEMQALGGTYQDYENPFTKKEYEDFARKEGYLASDKQYTDKYFTDAILNPMKFEQLMETPGFKGASDKFASGGIASLTKTIPPESGPTPQGLPYVYNSVKKI